MNCLPGKTITPGNGSSVFPVSGSNRVMRLDLVAEKLEAHRPWAGQREDVEDAAAQGELPLLADLRLRLVALILEPLNEVERVDALAKLEAAEPVF